MAMRRCPLSADFQAYDLVVQALSRTNSISRRYATRGSTSCFRILDHGYTGAKERDGEAVGRTSSVSQQHARQPRILSNRHQILAKGYASSRSSYTSQNRSYSTSSTPWTRNVFIALGSNVGDPVKNIERACEAIDRDPAMHIVDTSCLYRTKPMYVEDQNDFVNGACEIETNLEPLALLGRLQGIEKNLGRVKTIDKGPRNIDLDIVAYADREMKTERLTIPHAQMHERTFVLRPLSDLERGRIWKLPLTGTTVEEQPATFDTALSSLTPLGPPDVSLDARKVNGKTVLMSILNVTPDSFSDGGKNFSGDAESLRRTIESHIVAGAQIIDIGGQSSRPNAADISAEEEIDRILPAIKAVQSARNGDSVAISVDTYRARVAEVAVKNGAHIINDISGGLLDSEMLPTVARLGCTYVLMHMRGTPATMSNKTNCTYANGVINGVAEELSIRLRAAIDAGIRRWRIVLDPGIGFAKDLEDNLGLLRSLPALCQDPAFRGIPWLVGSSKKRFIGQITGVQNADERSWGTAATVTAAIAGGAHVVRVHDVKEMAAVVKMSDAIFTSCG